MKIKVHIERVILDGIEVDHRRHFGRALEKELTRRLEKDGVSPELRKGGAMPYMDGGAVQLTKRAHPAGVGTQIAGAVYRGIGGRR